jgi:[ribosomal protein S5]-alanine N-acetyltransferase
MAPHPSIETKRLTLRPLAPEHAAALHEIYSSPEAMRFWHTPPHVRMDETLDLIDQRLTPDERSWALMLGRNQNTAIGQISFLGNPGPPGMGYILDPRYWGNGYMTEAVQAALEFGYGELGYDQVELWISRANLASQKLAARNGFKRRGEFLQKYPHNVAEHQTLIYGLRLEEWLSATQRRAAPDATRFELDPLPGV